MKILTTVLFCGLLASCADVSAARTELRTFTLADLDAAHASAVAHQDPVAAGCWQAVGDALRAQGEIPSTAAASSSSGAATAWQIARNVRRRIGAGVPDAVNTACAPLVLDAQKTLARLGLMIGTPLGLP
jgi:hypothetical protein